MYDTGTCDVVAIAAALISTLSFSSRRLHSSQSCTQ